MKTNWWKLQELERQAYLSIVTGDKPLSYFDTFVKTWKKEGGEQITREVAEDHF
jgi:putative aldouronate transport system substrate-binding protein